MTAVDWDVDLVWGGGGEGAKKGGSGVLPRRMCDQCTVRPFQSSWYFITVCMTRQGKQSNTYLKRVEVRGKHVVSRIPINSNCSWTQFLCYVCSIVAYLASATHSSAADTNQM